MSVREVLSIVEFGSELLDDAFSALLWTGVARGDFPVRFAGDKCLLFSQINFVLLIPVDLVGDRCQ